MSYFHPSSPEHFRERNSLLQICMRPEPLPFTIEQEFPIVLSLEGKPFSYCMKHGNKLSSHANLWPRELVDRQGRSKGRIGLVGNVATDPAQQGRGHMRELLSEVEESAKKMALDALVLWSDLDQFYHKLGYVSAGQEQHFHFGKDFAPPILGMPLEFQLNPTLEDSDLEEFLKLRPTVSLTLNRSVQEYRKLLSIPWLDCFVARDEEGRIAAYSLVGKGYDMIGVMHEWGFSNHEALFQLIKHICRTLPFEAIRLLAPEGLETTLKTALERACAFHEKHAMGLIKVLGQKQKREDFASLFIWGLDSI